MENTLRVMACAPLFGAPGDVAGNTSAILSRIEEARAKEVQLLVLPELCLTGSAMGSLFTHSTLASACMKAALQIAEACGRMRCVFGLPVWDGPSGLPYNALALVEEGRIAAFVFKQNLQPHQLPFFRPGTMGRMILDGRTVPCSPEDHLHFGKKGRYMALVRFYDDLEPPRVMFKGINPSLLALPALSPAQACLTSLQPVNLKSRPFGGCALVYANAGGQESTTDLVYPGDAVICQEGEALAAADAFSGGAAVADVSLDSVHKKTFEQGFGVRVPWDMQMPYAPKEGALRALWCRDSLEIAARGLATRMGRIGIKAATIGVSGGLDSTMALLVTKRAFEILDLPTTTLYAYSLPGLGTSGKTKENAIRLMEALGLVPRAIDLTTSIHQHFSDIGQDEDVYDAAYENAQARERTQVLMDKANQVQGLMVGSGDLSELALGFTTFGGDHMSMYGVNAGLYKSAIRLIVHQAAHDTKSPELRQVLLDILDTPISPELLPGEGGQIVQKTEELLGPYVLNDFFLHVFLTQGASPQLLLTAAKNAFGGTFEAREILERMHHFFRRFFSSQFKRNCMPDGPNVLGVSLSPRLHFSLASDASASAWLAAIDQLKGNLG